MAIIKKPKLGLFDKNPVEAQIREVADGVAKSLKNDLLEESVATAWRQLLQESRPSDVEPQSQESDEKLQKGKEVDIFNKEQWLKVEPAINYAAEIVQVHERATSSEQREIRTRVQEIVVELKQISQSMKELELEVKDVNIEFIPEKPGKYQINFLEWVVMQLKNARLRIQESATWMSVVTAKKEKKGFWAKAKKYGTTYSLSGERQVAQQVG